MFHGSGEGSQNGGSGKGRGRKRQDGGRIHAKLMTREMAIRLINGKAMEDQIWRFFHGQKIHRDVRRVLMWLAPPEVKYQTHPTAGKLNELVQTANDKKIPATRRIIKRAVDQDVVSEEEEGRETFYYLDAYQFAVTQLILVYTDVVQDVVRKQVADPHNPTAGIELFEELAEKIEDFELPKGV